MLQSDTECYRVLRSVTEYNRIGGENLASSIHCLFRLARKYLSVQATSTPAERVMSSMGIVLEKRRQSMTGELFAEIMFLSDTV